MKKEKCLKCKLCAVAYKVTNEYSHLACVIGNKNIDDVEVCPMDVK